MNTKMFRCHSCPWARKSICIDDLSIAEAATNLLSILFLKKKKEFQNNRVFTVFEVIYVIIYCISYENFETYKVLCCEIFYPFGTNLILVLSLQLFRLLK